MSAVVAAVTPLTAVTGVNVRRNTWLNRSAAAHIHTKPADQQSMRAAAHHASTPGCSARRLQPAPGVRRPPPTRHRCRPCLAPPEAANTDVLSWADADGDADQLPVRIEQGPYGRCLAATEDVPNASVLLSVPTERVFSSQRSDELEMHWAAEMGLRLLQARHAARHGHASSVDMRPWLASLPARVVTPVEFTAAEVQALTIPSTVQAVLDARASLEGCYELLQPEVAAIGCGWSDFLWAVQVLHSRCFYEPASQRHLAVPGVDMCNHSSSAPNATVRLVHSPAACQGLQALEEVAPAAVEAVSQSFFQLVVDTNIRSLPRSSSGSSSNSSDALKTLFRPNGIAAGEHVCISYGPWPSEPFLLLFGFVPQDNPHDSLVLFTDLQHAAAVLLECTAASHSSEAAAAIAGHLPQAVADAEAEGSSSSSPSQDAVEGGPPGFRDLSVSPSAGVDRRMAHAVQLLQQAIPAAAAAAGVDQPQQAAAVAHLQQLVGEALLPWRLQQLAGQLEAAAAAAAADGHNGAVGEVVGSAGIRYSPSAEHRQLIAAYCSSKAALARQLLPRRRNGGCGGSGR